MSKEPKRNVYVGHRYVPKIMGEWDKSQTYEGLSIVTNEGTSYTSKKRVPKGIDILNEEYWVVTGNYNAQIEEYRGEVSRIKKDMTDLETDLTKYKTDLETDLTKNMTDFVNDSIYQTNEKTNSERLNVVYPPNDLTGAKGDGVSDDLQSLNAIVSYANGLDEKPVLYFPSGYQFRTTDTLNVPKGISIIMDSPILYDGVDTKEAMVIGDYNSHNMKVFMKIDVVSKNLSSWKNENNVGVKILNAYSCNINIFNVQKFSRGVEFLASNSLGHTMNEINLNYFSDNKESVVVAGENKGWPNANTYYNGLFYRHGETHPGKRSTSIRIYSKDKSYENINSNIFYSPKFEARKDNICFEFEGANFNKIVDLRAENNSDELLGVLKNCYNNSFTSVVLYNQSSKIVNEGSRVGTYLDEGKRTIYNSGKLGQKAIVEDSVVELDELEFIDNLGKIVKGTTSVNINENKDMVFPYGNIALSFLLDTKKVKKFNVILNSDNPMRIGFIPYTKDGVKMLSNEPIVDGDEWGHPYAVKGQVGYAELFGGILRVGTPENQARFEVREDISYVRVIIQRQESGTTLTNFVVDGVGSELGLVETFSTSTVYTEL